MNPYIIPGIDKNYINDTTVANDVVRAVASSFQVSYKDLLSPSRIPEVLFPRHMATYLIEKNTEFDYTQIGTMVNRDRSNVYNSLKRAKELLETNADFWFLSFSIQHDLNTIHA